MKEGELRPIELTGFADRETLATGLARRIARHLREAAAEHGHALLAISGGSTPKRLFQVLSVEDVDWEKVTVTLVDERFVPPDDARSNQKLVETHLLVNAAVRARFVPLYQPTGDADRAAGLAAERIDALPGPFDAVILGMGPDGHTASFFPGGDRLAVALDRQAKQSVVAMTAPGAEEPRLTLTLPHLLASRLLVLHIEGEGKMHALEKARATGPVDEMPIRAVLDAVEAPLEVYWAP